MPQRNDSVEFINSALDWLMDRDDTNMEDLDKDIEQKMFELQFATDDPEFDPEFTHDERQLRFEM